MIVWDLWPDIEALDPSFPLRDQDDLTADEWELMSVILEEISGEHANAFGVSGEWGRRFPRG